MTSNENSARRAGRPLPRVAPIESLEGRTLFVATPGPNFSAVMAHLQSTAASQLRLAQHVEASTDSLNAARAAAVKAVADGKALIAADQASIKAAAGDWTAQGLAKQKLAQDKAAVKASVLGAKADVKSLQAQAKSDGAALKAALKKDRDALVSEMSTSNVSARKAVEKLLNDWKLVQVGTGLTPADLQTLGDDLLAAADGATQPSSDSVAALRKDGLLAIADGTLTDEEDDVLLADLKVVFTTAGVSDAQATKIVADVETIVDKIQIDPDGLKKIIGDVESTLAAFSGL